MRALSMKPNPSTTGTGAVKAPPLLLGMTLLFWGWQAGFLLVGALLAVALEGARFIKTRWDFSDEDFHRIWDFCTLLILGGAIFAFTSNAGPGGVNSLFRGSALAVENKVGLSGEHAATALLRWLPMILFPVVLAQAASPGGAVPLTAISIIMRWRRRRALKRGRTMAPGRRTDVCYPYFILCLFSASIHTNTSQGDHTLFWGIGALLTWALWPFRSRRFGVVVWASALALILAAGYLGQNALSRLEPWAEGYGAQWFVHFLRQKTDPNKNVTSLGQIGRLKLSGRIVIRLHPLGGGAPPTYLREGSYRNYRLQTWYAGRSRFDFDYLSHTTNESTWLLLPGKTNSATVKIACYLPGGKALLPLPTGSGELDDLNVYVLSANRSGMVLAEGPGLVVFNASYGPGATLDSPPYTNWDFLVPSNEAPVLDQVISQMKLSGRDERETLQRVQAFFQGQFSYSTWQLSGRMVGTNETPLSRFLLQTHAGHCEYFATATTLLLRRLGIPARYAVGYVVHEPGGSGYVVRERDAHAWCLAWNQQNNTWEDFDTTPASWIETEDKRASSLQWFSDFWSWVGFQIARFRWGQAEWRQYFLWTLIPVLGLLLYQILFRRGRKRPPPQRTGDRDALMNWPGLDSEFYQLEDMLAERGAARQDSELLSDWLARVLAEPALGDLRVPLQELLRLHYRHRFDPHGLSAPDREQLKHQARECLAALMKKR